VGATSSPSKRGTLDDGDEDLRRLLIAASAPKALGVGVGLAVKIIVGTKRPTSGQRL
jgi:hypothetical protein